MKRILTLAVLVLVATVLLPPPASAQFGGGMAQPRARLYARVDGDEVRAAIEIKIARGWHLYHEELGHPDAVGKPTKITLTGTGVTWSPMRFPEPHKTPQLDGDVYILSHEGTIVVYAAGRLDREVEAATGEDLAASLDGLTCQDDGMCILYNEVIETKGAGDDALFEAFPADLVVAAPLKDDHKGGKADASLYTRRDGRTLRVAIEVKIERRWHLYHKVLGHPDAVGIPTQVVLSGGDSIAWSEVVFPAPHEYPQPDWDAFILGHEGTIVLSATGELAEGVDDPGPIRAEMSGLTCQDDGMCIPYREGLVDRGRGPDELFRSIADDEKAEGGAEGGADETGANDGSATESDDEEQGLAGFLWLAVFWGLFTLLMPCTYPMIPITISFFTKQAADRQRSVLPLALVYGAGIVLIFILIGVTIGGVIIQFATHPVTNLVIGGLFFYFALVLFGFINLQPPRFLLDVAGKASSTGGYLGVFLMGATLVVTSFTCTAPFVGSLLAVGGVDRSTGEVALGMGVFGLTMAVPFVVLSLVPGMVRNIPRSGEWMNTLKVFLGFVELAAAFKFFSNTDLVWEWNVLSRELFLLLWTTIFVVGAVFLFGLLPGKRAKPGPVRSVVAALVLAFAGYCAWGMTGREVDSVMTAIVPNYSGGALMPAWKDFGGEWDIVVDDYDGAQQLARKEKKLLFVNFTGHT
jgi:thiol:disulfide interchange protein DsbD